MKRIAFFITVVLLSTQLFAQNKDADSLRMMLKKEKTDTGKIILLYQISHAYQGSKPDSALLLGQEAYFLAKKIKYLKGESWALNQMAFAFNSLGNIPRALEYYIEQLKIEENRGFQNNIASIYLNIALLYSSAKDYEKAIAYAKNADSIINANQFKQLSLYSLLDIGEIYEKQNVLDSAVAYTKKCYEKSVEANNELITGTALNNLGNIYFKTGNLTEALDKYKAGLPHLQAASDYSNYTEGLLGMARIFDRNQQTDSAIIYGKKSFNIALSNQFLLKAMDASSFLTQAYKKQKNTDSAFAYQDVMLGLKDSTDSRDKIKQEQNITLQEQLRQKELAQLRIEEIKERRQKLQLLAIGISIPIFFLLSIIISRKKVHKKLIEFSGIISILLLFEYITLLLHPFIADKSHHNPFIEIVIFVAIAAVITPAHHRIQHWLISKLTEFNFLRHHKAIPPQNENINEDEVII